MAHHRHKVHKKASGGKIEEEVMREAKKGGTNPGIKPIQKKDGGKVEGKHSHHRLDKRARGGKIGKFARGGSPFSAAANVKK